MKCFRRCLSVSLCLLLLLGAFSAVASAEVLDVGKYTIKHSTLLWRPDAGSEIDMGFTHFTPGDGNEHKQEWELSLHYSTFLNGRVGMYSYYDVRANDKILAVAGIPTTFKLESAYHSTLIYAKDTGYQYYDMGPVVCGAFIYYSDGTNELWTGKAQRVGTSFNFHASVIGTPTKDVVGVKFYIKSDCKDDVSLSSIQSGYVELTSYTGEWGGDDANKFTVIQPSEEETLLGGINDKLSNVFNGILELPAKIVTGIIDGLKSLVIPSDDFWEDIADRFDSLLADRFGAVYQVVKVTLESWTEIEVADADNTVYIPEVSIPMPDNNEFTFGGSDVKIVPSGFEWLADLCKVASGAICTLIFVNGLRKRYEEVMGVER